MKDKTDNTITIVMLQMTSDSGYALVGAELIVVIVVSEGTDAPLLPIVALQHAVVNVTAPNGAKFQVNRQIPMTKHAVERLSNVELTTIPVSQMIMMDGNIIQRRR